MPSTVLSHASLLFPSSTTLHSYEKGKRRRVRNIVKRSCELRTAAVNTKRYSALSEAITGFYTRGNPRERKRCHCERVATYIPHTYQMQVVSRVRFAVHTSLVQCKWNRHVGNIKSSTEWKKNSKDKKKAQSSYEVLCLWNSKRRKSRWKGKEVI